MQERRKFIADTVDKLFESAQIIDKLGDQFRAVLKAAWLAYIQEVYPVEGAQELETAMTGSVLVGGDD